ncbi:hypothetical protein [uncultured Gilvimarinus sp.]|uniref:hypothetical protein n=1 Tax=uncultured Gilvimarinus sp. TaxID=1689143 RepID=UPI0030EBBD52
MRLNTPPGALTPTYPLGRLLWQHLQWLAAILVALACVSHAEAAKEDNKPDVSAYRQWQNSHSGSFFVDSQVDFSGYDKILFFPATFDRMTLSEHASNEVVLSWQKSSFKEMDAICAQFDSFAPVIFNRSDEFSPTHTGGLNVIALEFRITEFYPKSERVADAELDTVGQTFSDGSLGSIKIQAVLVNAKTGALLAVIEDLLPLQHQAYINNRTSQNLAWRTAFKSWLIGLEQDLSALKAGEHQDQLAPGAQP